MNPHYSTERTTNQSECTTSLWTETFRASAAHAGQEPAYQAAMPQHLSYDETQTPTHDALSTIYNRGYRGR